MTNPLDTIAFDDCSGTEILCLIKRAIMHIPETLLHDVLETVVDQGVAKSAPMLVVAVEAHADIPKMFRMVGYLSACRKGVDGAMQREIPMLGTMHTLINQLTIQMANDLNLPTMAAHSMVVQAANVAEKLRRDQDGGDGTTYVGLQC